MSVPGAHLSAGGRRVDSIERTTVDSPATLEK